MHKPPISMAALALKAIFYPHSLGTKLKVSRLGLSVHDINSSFISATAPLSRLQQLSILLREYLNWAPFITTGC